MPGLWLPTLTNTAAAPVCTCRGSHANRSFVAETTNFVITARNEARAITLARRAEALRLELSTKWMGHPSDDWQPKCQIILYSTHRAYVAAVGRGSESTVGSSLVDTRQGAVTSRRIDLSSESADYLADALPYELTHVILKDRFAATPLSRWADEGMALLADTPAKQRRHNNDLQRAVASNGLIGAAQLFELDSYPRPAKSGVFYGKSLSLTDFLVARSGPQRFVEFGARARTEGFDGAARTCYGFKNIADLDRQWRRRLDSDAGLLAVNARH